MVTTQNEITRARYMMGLLSSLNQELGLHPTLPDAMTRILMLSIESVKAESGSIMLLDENGEISHAALVYAGKIDVLPTDSMRTVAREGLAGWVIENRQAAMVQSTRDDPRWLRQVWEVHKTVARSAVCVPLLYAQRVLGVLTLVQRRQGGFSPGDLALLSALAFCVSSTSIKAALNSDHTGWQ